MINYTTENEEKIKLMAVQYKTTEEKIKKKIESKFQKAKDSYSNKSDGVLVDIILRSFMIQLQKRTIAPGLKKLGYFFGNSQIMDSNRKERERIFSFILGELRKNATYRNDSIAKIFVESDTSKTEWEENYEYGIMTPEIHGKRFLVVPLDIQDYDRFRRANLNKGEVLKPDCKYTVFGYGCSVDDIDEQTGKPKYYPVILKMSGDVANISSKRFVDPSLLLDYFWKPIEWTCREGSIKKHGEIDVLYLSGGEELLKSITILEDGKIKDLLGEEGVYQSLPGCFALDIDRVHDWLKEVKKMPSSVSFNQFGLTICDIKFVDTDNNLGKFEVVSDIFEADAKSYSVTPTFKVTGIFLVASSRILMCMTAYFSEKTSELYINASGIHVIKEAIEDTGDLGGFFFDEDGTFDDVGDFTKDE